MVAARGRGSCGFEDLVLGLRALQQELEALVVGLQGGGCCSQEGEFALEVADMAFFAFAEGSLAVKGDCV